MKGNLRRNPLTGVRAGLYGSENSRWPGFSAFDAGVVGGPVTGTPFEPGGLMPSSYKGLFTWEGEHSGWGEPILPGTPEYQARWQAAISFTYPLFANYLMEIYNASGGFASKYFV